MRHIQMDLIAANFARVLERIAASASKAGRPVDPIRLVVVTKGHPVEAVQAAIASGAQDLGENYVEEALPKMEALSGPEGVRWHMVGHVQSRKARAVSERFDWVHSLDSLKLAARLDRFAGESGRRLPVLLECNVSGEESKFGWKAYPEVSWGELAEAIGPLLELQNLEVRGLMTMAPFSPDSETARPYFKRLRRLQSRLADEFPSVTWDELSMGMSADFEIAIQEGATMVRVGTAVLGERPQERN
jgi:PLP dependent protein